MPIAPLAAVQSFTNRTPSFMGIKQDGGVQAKLAAMQSAPASAVAPDNTGLQARQAALQAQQEQIGAHSSRMTGYKQQAAYKKEAARLQSELNRVKTSQENRPQINITPTPGTPGAGGNLPAASGTGVRAQIIKNAQSLLGTPYAWGGGGIGNRSSRGTGKGTQGVIGVDCSGLTSYVYGLIGVNLPRISNSQLATGVKTSISNAQPGDLVGWGPGGHVAIYAGNGMIIESPKPGGHVQTRKLGGYDSRRGVYAVRLRLPGE